MEHKCQRYKDRSRHKDLETLLGYIQLSDQHVKDVCNKTLPSFIEQKKPKPKEEIPLKQENVEHKGTSKLVEEQLIHKLIDGEISNEAFNNAVNLLRKSKNETNSLNGYQ